MKNLLLILLANLLIGSVSIAQVPDIMRALEEPSQNELENQDPIAPEINLDKTTSSSAIKVKLFPNPAAGSHSWLTVTQMPDSYNAIAVTFMDPFGGVIYQDKLSITDTYFEYRLSLLERLTPGIYYVSIQVNDQRVIETLMVE